MIILPRNKFRFHLPSACIISVMIILLFCVFTLRPGAGTEVEMHVLQEVTVHGNAIVPDSAVTARLELTPGDEVSLPGLEERVRRANEWGGFGELSYNISPRRDGIEVDVLLDERIELGAVQLRGNRAISDRELLRRLPLEQGRVLEYDMIRNAKDQLLRHYHEEGYELASIEETGRFHEDGSFTLVFDITEGKRLRVRRIRFRGNTAFSENRLRRIMDTHVYLRIPFIRKGRFEHDVFQEDMRKIEERYYNAGYLDAKVAGYRTYTRGFDGYELNVVIYEGARYRISEIKVDGNKLFRDEEIIREADISPGDVYTEDILESVQRNIARLYATQGLVDVSATMRNLSVDPVLHTEEGLVEVLIKITETEPVYVRRIRVEGLTRTDELVVLRHLRFEPGDRVDRGAFEASERALLDTGYFDLTRPGAVDISLAPGRGRFRDVVVSVREGPTGNLMFGAGVSSEAGVTGNISLTEKNFDITNWPRSWSDFRERSPFRGGGQELSFMLNVGSERSDFQISFREPRIRHTDYSFGARAYSTLNRWEFFDLIRAGGAVSFGRRLGEHVHQQVELGLEHIHVSRMADDAPREISRDDGTYLKPYLGLSLRRDTRDSRMFPTSGYVGRIGAEFAVLDIRKAELTGEFEHYWTTYVQRNERKQVLMLRGAAGVMDAYGGGRRIPVFERFYGGGMGSVRGFEWWGIAPVEPEDQEQVGGKSRLTGTAEYTIPLFTDHFRLAFFADAGYVEERARDVFSGWDKLRVSSGAGIRWFIPAMGGIPVTLDLAVPFEREEHDVTRNLHFHLGLGHAF